MSCRYCEGNNAYINNTHKHNENIKGLIYRGEDYGLIIFVDGCSKAVFDIEYCPMCGRKLKKMIQSEDLCVACGRYVVEGRHICKECAQSVNRVYVFENGETSSIELLPPIVKALNNEKRREKMIREYEEKLKKIVNNDDDQPFNFFEKIYCKNAIKILKDVEG